MKLKYPLNSPVLGIDVSKYQGTIDWPQVAASGCSYAFIRLGYANRDGSITLDSYFERNVRGAINAGVKVGVYLYSYIETVDAARIAATKTIELIKDYKISMPVAFDYELSSLYSTYSRDKNTDICNAYMEIIANAGYLPMFYSYTSFINAYMNMDRLNKYEGLWIANYTGKIGVDDAAIWQFSSYRTIPGIKGRVDMNRMYFDVPRIVEEFYTKNNSIAFKPLTNKNLEVIVDDKCEYFTKPSIDATVMGDNGKTLRLPVGHYTALSIADVLVDGFTMVKIDYDGQEVYVAVLDDRCRLVDKPAEGLNVTIYPVPNAGDRANIENYLSSLGFSMEIKW